MRPLKLVLAAAFCLVATLAQAAGFRLLDIPADHDGPTLTGAVWYPCAQPPGSVKLGFLVMSVAKDCPITGENLPLVVISHGWSGSFIGHRDIAETLADAGFIVAAIDHGDSATNERRNGDFSVLIERPTDVRRVRSTSCSAHGPTRRGSMRRVSDSSAFRGEAIRGLSRSVPTPFSERRRSHARAGTA
ncbi:hypothetical protein [Burkholderia ubonensis]|uniref:alpha/beta hydrolase n=1 Tax=Burkholderia ubonensis TaxID=101571 RepID=UPI002FC9B4DD